MPTVCRARLRLHSALLRVPTGLTLVQQLVFRPVTAGHPLEPQVDSSGELGLWVDGSILLGEALMVLLYIKVLKGVWGLGLRR